MPANTTVNVSYNGGNPQITQNGAIDLNYGDTLTLNLVGFPASQEASIDTIEFYGNTTDGQGNDQKNPNDPKGSWTRANGNGSSLSAYSCTGQSGGEAQIEDVESTDEDDKYWYGIVISHTGGSWNVDPELINKGSRS